MSSFKSLAMAKTVASHQEITIQKSFFGLVQKAVYNPTNSPILAYQYDYTTENGIRIKQVLNASAAQFEQAVEQAGQVNKAPVGPFRAEICLSADHRFAAVQLFGYNDFEYFPLLDVIYYEGQAAELIAKLFG